jgi:hypothetical protein
LVAEKERWPWATSGGWNDDGGAGRGGATSVNFTVVSTAEYLRPHRLVAEGLIDPERRRASKLHCGFYSRVLKASSTTSLRPDRLVAEGLIDLERRRASKLLGGF